MEKTVENFRDDLIIVDGQELYPIPNFSRYYVDLDEGRIWNNKSERWITANPNYLGYCYARVKADDEGKSKSISVHNLVMMAMTGKDKTMWRSQGLEVHHIDNDTKNNEATNLMLVSRSQQYQDPITKITLSNRSNKRLTKIDVIAIKTDWIEWEGRKGEFYSKWADELGMHTRGIQDVILGNTWKNVEVE
ncbi:hypothetical protein J2Z83_000089 [Virgibacillus natechei]|uniref:HNH nuclease domain-containing protein n=1 Tax=Virgibacillus natechei TaxID=1216297 RepID=A0ABS4IAP0_9BACI|nr:HNH endonuclease [Virgibacillus natechei]MBP1967997.1 hypothetical protein [Virgibacillus natechei]UZD14720.1 HNH endonuclease [Virgibacillus natechei]